MAIAGIYELFSGAVLNLIFRSDCSQCFPTKNNLLTSGTHIVCTRNQSEAKLCTCLLEANLIIQCNSNSMKVAFCFLPNPVKVIISQYFIWHDSCICMTCSNILNRGPDSYSDTEILRFYISPLFSYTKYCYYQCIIIDLILKILYELLWFIDINEYQMD